MASILMVVTNACKIMNGKDTGVWLSEFAEAYLAFHDAGHHVIVASPRGGEAPIDPTSTGHVMMKEWEGAVEALLHTVSLDQVDCDQLDGVFLAGGHGTMFDFPGSDTLQRVLQKMAEANKVIGAVCHGSAGFTRLVMPDGTPFLKGRRLTTFTNQEEKEMDLDKQMPFLLESKVRELGATFVSAPIFTENVEVDGNVVTGQNPQSTIRTAQKFLEKIEGMKHPC
ncbi:Putative intracellular protease/amidase [Alteribacillus persepolensis]|uniref:Putative intracellular protease/amidase n=1 Tax=Alteribacillus persepolensis TaxID=568899 RepID=A0A1G7Z7G4_9BACI|nr:type 1 glutamine amidotransferase domain-containing protein [Alteribacillus persepolensis]SDH04691.1 Putative intracellular protease/amidase [Alteribacillus persepolensis]